MSAIWAKLTLSTHFQTEGGPNCAHIALTAQLSATEQKKSTIKHKNCAQIALSSVIWAQLCANWLQCECECKNSPWQKSMGMIHNMHGRMDHKLSVPLSAQSLGLYRIRRRLGNICELIFCPSTLWDEQRHGTAHKFCNSELKLLMPAETYYRCRSLHNRSCYLDPSHQLIHGSCHAHR